MNRLEDIERLKSEIVDLQEKFKKLDGLLDVVKSCLGEDKFLETELNSELRNLLLGVDETQNRIKSAYLQYSLGALQQKVGDAAVYIADYCDKLSKEKLAAAAVAFMKTLKAKKPEVDALLNCEREFLEGIVLEELQAKDELNKLDKYIDLMLAFDEQDKQKRFMKLIPALAGKLDSILLFEICDNLENFDFVIPKDCQTDAITKAGNGCAEAVQEVTAEEITRVEAIEQATPETQEVKAEVKEPTEIKIEAVTEEDKIEELAVENNIPEASIDVEAVEQEPVAVENEVLPEEDIAKPEPEPVKDERELFIEQDKSIVIVHKASRKDAGNYTTNKFKVQSKGWDISLYRKVFGSIDRQGYFLTDGIDLPDEEKEELIQFVDRQMRLGYLESVDVKGFGMFYILDRIGVSALKDSAFRRALSLGQNKKRMDIPMFSSFNPFNIVSFIKIREYILKDFQNSVLVEQEQVENNVFSSVFNVASAGDAKIVLVGVAGDKGDDVNKLKNSLSKLKENSVLIIAGIDNVIAERNEQWIMNIIPENVQKMIENRTFLCSIVDGETKDKQGNLVENILDYFACPEDVAANTEEQTEQSDEKAEASEAVSVEAEQEQEVFDSEEFDVPEECLVDVGELEPEVIAYEDKEKKVMTPKEFKKNLGTNVMCRYALKNLMTNGFIGIDTVASFFDKSVEACEFNIGLCHKAGLLRKFEYKGYPGYYALSPKGSTLCNNASIFSFLEINGSRSVDVQQRYSEISNASAIGFIDCENYLAKMLKMAQIKWSSGLEYDSFIYRAIMPGIDEKKNTIIVFGCYTQDSYIFREFAHILSKLVDQAAFFVCVGWNEMQAKAMTEWAKKTFNEHISFNIIYKVIGNDMTYDFDGDGYDNLTGAMQAISNKMNNKGKDLQEENRKNQRDKILEQVLTEKEDKPAEPETVAETVPEPEKKKKNIKNKPIESPTPVDESAHDTDEVIDNFILDKSDVESYIDNFSKMLLAGKIYAACAYLKVLSGKDKRFESLYKQMAYASGDPLGGCSYSSKVVSDVFYGAEACDNHLFVSAALRTFFLDYFSYDYHISELQGAVLSSNTVESLKPLGTLVKEIGDFKNKHNCGLDHYADYHQSSNKDIDKELADLRAYTAEQYDHYITNFKEDIANKRFSEARKLFLDKNGEVAKLLTYIIKGNDSRQAISEIKKYLKDNIIKDEALIREENIDSQKIDDIIEDTWNRAAEHINYSIRSSDLMSALRKKYSNQIERLVKPLCNYVVLNEAKVPVDNPEASLAYKKLRGKLLKSVTESIEALKLDETNGIYTAVVLIKTLEEIGARLDGSYKAGNEKYFYLDFLKTDNILLDEQYLPYLQDVDENLPAMSALRRIEQHLSSKETSLEKRCQSILDSEDNYASLECLLQYMDVINPGYSVKFRKEKALKLSMENAAKGLDFYREEFDNDIELRQSYGQIDETEGNRKEELISLIDLWYEWAKETTNYGFFRKICEAYIERIEADALPRGQELSRKLADFKLKHPEKLGEDIVDEAVRTVEERIRIKNFTAAEDLLNRIERDELMVVKDVVEFDYLRNFISNYTNLYQDVFNMRSSMREVLAKRMPHNKEGKAAARIMNAWIPGPEVCQPERVKELLESLDFTVGEIVERSKMGSAHVFDVTLARPEDGRKVKYKHPIAAFGSVAETEAFRVAFVFGNYETQGLLDISNTLGDAQDTLLFMDGALQLSTRRNLARKAKETTRKIFAVVDRVVLAYLVRFFKPAAIQKMLMNIIIPFAYCQPYVADSVNVMPPEMFMGRENELAQIESYNGVNIVYGGRQLGKSAMLRMAQNHIDRNERGDRAVFVDIVGLDYEKACRKVSMILEEEGILKNVPITSDWEELAHNLRVRLKSEEDRIPYLLLLLDEADEFISTAAEVNYGPIDALKDVQGVGIGRFKFVFAGLRDVIRFDRQALGNNSVMTKLASLTVRPFDVNEARVLLEKPLSYLGFRFAKDKETESLIASIFSSTNYFPGLLQLYCTNLIKALQKPDYAGYDEVDTPAYEVSVEHIKKVLGGTELQKQIREKFFITLQLDEKDDNFYYMIALLVALQHHMDAENSDVTPSMLLALADQYGIGKFKELDEQKAYALMEELCELNVLHNSVKGYRFTRYSFYQMMGTKEQIEDKLLGFMED